jgi:tripartite-type tricarboxylate transporter receptor subunit TctC
MWATEFRRLYLLVAALAIMALVAACAGDEPDDPDPAEAEEPEEEEAPEEPEEPEEPAVSFDGESIRYIIPTAPGGGADAIGQFLNPYWNEFLPGNPSVDIDYVPGAGGVAGGNEFHLRAEPDGLTVMQGTLSSATAFLLGEEEVQYDMAAWNPVVAFSTSGMMHVRTDTGIETVQDVLDYDGELVIGGRAPTASDIMHVFAMEVLGFRDKVNHVWGYEGTGEQLLAMEAGETNLDGTTDNAWLDNGVELEEAGISRPLIAYGLPDGEGGFERHPSIDAPTVDEAYEEIYGEPPSGEAWDAFVAAMNIMSVATIVALPQDADEGVYQAWRNAAVSMIEETDFVEEWMATLNPNPPMYTEEQIENAREALLGIDEAMQTWMRQFLVDNYPDQME